MVRTIIIKKVIFPCINYILENLIIKNNNLVYDFHVQTLNQMSM